MRRILHATLNHSDQGPRRALSAATPRNYCWGLDHGYDIWANLLSATVTKGNDVPMLSQSVGTNNRLSGYSYDAAGNMLSDGSFSYTWDAESRMKTGAGVTYTYDGDGRRVKKSNGKLYWYGAGLDALMETDLAGNNADEYIFFGGKRVARRQFSGAVNYYFSDHLGSSRVVASSAGAILDDSDFYPFGGERIVTSSSGNRYKFTGKERDPESNLDYFIARYYSSAMGRYLSPDWSEAPQPVPYADFNNPQTLNLYAYVANNPLNSTDPDGHCPDFLSCVTQVVVGAAQGVGNFATNVVSGLLTPARLSNGELATRPSEVTQALAEGVAQSVVTAAQDYASGQAAASFNALDAQGQMAVVTEGVLTGASAVATAAKGSPSAKLTPPGENAAAAAGRAADAALAAKVRGKPGWQSQPTIKGPNGETLRPDALTKSGRPLEQKPNTPSGHKRGATQLRKYEAATGKKGRVIYYDPEKYKKQ